MFTPPRSSATPAAFVAALLILSVAGAVPPDASAAETGPAARAVPEGALLTLESSGRDLAYTRLRVTDARGEELTAFMDVLDEKAYQKARLKVYRFLVDVAMDGVVLPKPAPGTRSLKAADSPETLDDDWDL